MTSSERLLGLVLARDPRRGIEDGPVYSVAGEALLTDCEIPELAPFCIGAGSAGPWPRPDLQGHGKTVFESRGWIGGELVKVVCRRHELVFELEVGGAGRFVVTADGGRILGPLEGEYDEQRARHAVLGPCLCLALALRSRFCLHASAVLAAGEAVLFLGESGAGKSTLAAAAKEAGWARLADDTLPVTCSARRARALPHFPQLKLQAREQWGASAPADVEIGRVYRLRRHRRGEAPLVRELSQHDAVVALLRHSVAARLFDRGLQVRHLEFSSWLAPRVGVRDLEFPSGREYLDATLAVIRADLE